MKLLLDTCTFLWICNGGRELSETARDSFKDPGNEVFLSAASCFEIAIKHQMKRLKLKSAVQSFVVENRTRHQIAPLHISEEDALHVGSLPPIHRDPFDRLLVAQAILHGLTLLTPDQIVRRYPARTMW